MDCLGMKSECKERQAKVLKYGPNTVSLREMFQPKETRHSKSKKKLPRNSSAEKKDRKVNVAFLSKLSLASKTFGHKISSGWLSKPTSSIMKGQSMKLKRKSTKIRDLSELKDSKNQAYKRKMANKLYRTIRSVETMKTGHSANHSKNFHKTSICSTSHNLKSILHLSHRNTIDGSNQYQLSSQTQPQIQANPFGSSKTTHYIPENLFSASRPKQKRPITSRDLRHEGRAPRREKEKLKKLKNVSSMLEPSCENKERPTKKRVVELQKNRNKLFSRSLHQFTAPSKKRGSSAKNKRVNDYGLNSQRIRVQDEKTSLLRSKTSLQAPKYADLASQEYGEFLECKSQGHNFFEEPRSGMKKSLSSQTLNRESLMQYLSNGKATTPTTASTAHLKKGMTGSMNKMISKLYQNCRLSTDKSLMAENNYAGGIFQGGTNKALTKKLPFEGVKVSEFCVPELSHPLIIEDILPEETKIDQIHKEVLETGLIDCHSDRLPSKQERPSNMQTDILKRILHIKDPLEKSSTKMEVGKGTKMQQVCH